MRDRFQARYRGKRYSFGYPACPDLGDQATLFRLLDGRKIGVELTDAIAEVKVVSAKAATAIAARLNPGDRNAVRTVEGQATPLRRMVEEGRPLTELPMRQADAWRMIRRRARGTGRFRRAHP